MNYGCNCSLISQRAKSRAKFTDTQSLLRASPAAEPIICSHWFRERQRERGRDRGGTYKASAENADPRFCAVEGGICRLPKKLVARMDLTKKKIAEQCSSLNLALFFFAEDCATLRKSPATSAFLNPPFDRQWQRWGEREGGREEVWEEGTQRERNRQKRKRKVWVHRKCTKREVRKRNKEIERER